MIEPPPFLRIVRVTACMPRKQPSWLTRHSSSTSSRRHPLDVAEAQDAGVVGEHVDRAEALVRVLDQRASRTPRR